MTTPLQGFANVDIREMLMEQRVAPIGFRLGADDYDSIRVLAQQYVSMKHISIEEGIKRAFVVRILHTGRFDELMSLANTPEQHELLFLVLCVVNWNGEGFRS